MRAAAPELRGVCGVRGGRVTAVARAIRRAEPPRRWRADCSCPCHSPVRGAPDAVLGAGIAAAALGAPYFITVTVLLWLRREEQPIKARRAWLTVLIG
jgi:hypothetical protein